MIYGALSFEQGLIPYKEYFIQHGVGASVIQGIIIKIFGHELIYLRESVAICYGIVTAITFLIAKIFTSEIVALLAVFLWGASAYYISPYPTYYIHSWPSVYALVCIVLIVYLYVKSEKLYFINFYFIGLLAALSGLFKINYGVVALLISLILAGSENTESRNRKIYAVLSGFACIVFPGIVYLLAVGAIYNFYTFQVLYGFEFFVGADKSNVFIIGYKNLLKLFFPTSLHGGVSALNFLFEYLTIGILAIQLIYKEKLERTEKKLFNIGLCSLVTTLLYVPVNALMHIILSGPLFYVFILGNLSTKIVKSKYEFLLRYIVILTIAIYGVVEVGQNHLLKTYTHRIKWYREYVAAPGLPFLKNIMVSQRTAMQLKTTKLIYLDGTNSNKCVLNYTQMPYFSALFAGLQAVNTGPPPFYWGPFYWDNINGMTKMTNVTNDICRNNSIVISSLPYLLDGYYLKYQIAGNPEYGTEGRQPITFYTVSQSTEKVGSTHSFFVKSLEKKVEAVNHLMNNEVLSYNEKYALKIYMESKSTNKTITGIFLEISDSSPFAGGGGDLLDQLKHLENSEMYSTNPVSPARLLNVYINDNLISNIAITEAGVKISDYDIISIIPDLTIMPDLTDSDFTPNPNLAPIANKALLARKSMNLTFRQLLARGELDRVLLSAYYRVRIQFSDDSIEESSGQLSDQSLNHLGVQVK